MCEGESRGTRPYVWIFLGQYDFWKAWTSLFKNPQTGGGEWKNPEHWVVCLGSLAGFFCLLVLPRFSVSVHHPQVCFAQKGNAFGLFRLISLTNSTESSYVPFFYHSTNFSAGFFPVLGSVLKPERDYGAPGCPVTGRGNACYYLLSSKPRVLVLGWDGRAGGEKMVMKRGKQSTGNKWRRLKKPGGYQEEQ